MRSYSRSDANSDHDNNESGVRGVEQRDRARKLREETCESKDGRTTPGKEDDLGEGFDRPDDLVTLKNGERIRAAIGTSTLDSLEHLLETRPTQFKVLCEVAKGIYDGGLPWVERELKREYILDEEGRPVKHVHDILMSSLRDVPDGVVLVDPFDPQNPDEADALYRSERKTKRAFGKLIRWLDDGYPPNGP